jgi:hypothetical protein
VTETKQLFAFVLTPFAAEFDDVYNIGIKEAAEAVGVLATRLDEQIFLEGMLERIYRQIEVADMIIADMSGKNPNVFYEVGFAHAKQKLCILLTQDPTDIPFDLKHRRHIVYHSVGDLRAQLTKNLEWAVTELATIHKSRVRVELRSDGDLTVDEHTAQAELDLKFDFFNDGERPSGDIHAVYFYSTQTWNVKHDDRDCAQIKADVPEFKYRYFLPSPVQRLPAKSWAQLRIKTRRIVAWALKGDTLKDEYTISGKAMLRLVMDTGTFDYTFQINERVIKFPF